MVQHVLVISLLRNTWFSLPENVGVAAALSFSSMLFLVLSHLMLACSRCELRHTSGWVLYSLIGDLCHLAGAFLSNQTFIQCTMAVIMATLDVLHFISVFLPHCWWSITGRRMRMLSRRRRQDSLVVCLLFGMGGCVYADLRACQLQASYGSPASRKLLNVIVHDQTELLGYVLGLLSFAISWTARIPFILKANRGQMSDLTHVSSRGFSALAGALYASAILLYELRLEPVVKALPWILSGACSAILDVSITLLAGYRICSQSQSTGALDSEAESLLDGFDRDASNTCRAPKDKNARRSILSLKTSRAKMPEMGRFTNTYVHPVRKVCLKEVTVTRSDWAESQPLRGSVKVLRVDECYSSGSASDSSSRSSELEWDFEETLPQCCSQNEDMQKTNEFPLQDWTVDQTSKSNMTSSPSACFCNHSDLDARKVSGSPETNFQSHTYSVK